MEYNPQALHQLSEKIGSTMRLRSGIMKKRHSIPPAAILLVSLGFPPMARAQGSSKAKVPSKTTEEAPMPERVASVAQYFSPPPGSTADLDPGDVRDLGKRDPLTLRGFISVRPPKGGCLTLRKSASVHDMRVCGKTPIAFKAADLKNDGSLQWQVLLDQENDPIDLNWPTPLRLGMRVPARKKLETISETFLLKNCQADSDSRGAVMRLVLGNGEVWTLIPPVEDVLAEQDPNLLDLYIQGSENLGGGIQTDKSKISRKSNNAPEAAPTPTVTPAPEIPEAASAHGDPKESPETAGAKAKEPGKGPEEAAGNGHGEKKQKSKPGKKDKPKGPVSKRFQVYETGERWTIPRRNAFEMPAGRLKTLNDEGPSNGVCRYQYSGAFQDPNSGWVECKDAGLFDAILVHLPCAKRFLELRKEVIKAQASKLAKDTP